MLQEQYAAKAMPDFTEAEELQASASNADRMQMKGTQHRSYQQSKGLHHSNCHGILWPQTHNCRLIRNQVLPGLTGPAVVME